MQRAQGTPPQRCRRSDRKQGVFSRRRGLPAATGKKTLADCFRLDNAFGCGELGCVQLPDLADYPLPLRPFALAEIEEANPHSVAIVDGLADAAQPQRQIFKPELGL